MRRRLLTLAIAALTVVFATLVVSGCGNASNAPDAKAQSEDAAGGHGHEDGQEHEEGHTEEGHAEEAVTLDAEQTQLAGIVVERVRKRTIQDSLEAPGTVNSTTVGRAVVTPPVAGRIVSMAVALGDSVRQGQTLAILESVELAEAWSRITDAERDRDAASASVREARSELELSLSNANAAKASLARQRELAQAGAFSQAPLQQAKNELNDAQSELLSVQRNQANHLEVVRRLESLYRDGIVSRAELETARLELQQDEIRLERARARIETAKAGYERESAIASRGLLNAKEIQSAEAELQSASLEAERARIRLRSLEAALATASRAVADARAVYRSSAGGGQGSVGRVALVAPISGTLTHLDVTRGQAVDRAQTLMEVENLSSVWVTANVPDRDAGKVRRGAEVWVTVAALKGLEFGGGVQIVGSRVDPKTRTVPVQCLIAGAGGRLKPQMFASVRIASGVEREAVAVPDSAIVTEQSASYVFVRHEDGEYVKTEVTLGLRSAGRTEVRSGLAPGEDVVVKGAFVLNSQIKKGELKGHEH